MVWQELGAIGERQVELLSQARRLLRAVKETQKSVLDPELYLNSWADVRGNAKLRRVAYGWRVMPFLWLSRLRDVFGLVRYGVPTASAFPDSERKFFSLVLSWAKSTDFGPDGVYRDRYLGVSSADTPQTLWLLLFLDRDVPSFLSENIVLLSTSRTSSWFGVFGNILKFFSRPVQFSCYSKSFADHVATILIKLTVMYGVRRVVMPYEAQPFQQTVGFRLQTSSHFVETVGYLHSMLPALPTDLIYRKGAPDKLLVHGDGQKEILVEWLGWSAESINVIESLRYRVGDATFAGKILLPYDIRQADKLLMSLEAYFRQAPLESMPSWIIQNHPVMHNSPLHKKFMDDVGVLLAKYSDRISSSPFLKNEVIIVGRTAAIIEALERKLEVIHVCTEPLFEMHTPALWKYLTVECLAPSVYRYRLSEYGQYIRFGGEWLNPAAILGL
ncbi:MAG: hypothetical protein HQL94_01565 [Magnetococcales bacterium]|nr:hypothetical protein [Magnetococcales bacterium]